MDRKRNYSTPSSSTCACTQYMFFFFFFFFFWTRLGLELDYTNDKRFLFFWKKKEWGFKILLPRGMLRHLELMHILEMHLGSAFQFFECNFLKNIFNCLVRNKFLFNIVEQIKRIHIQTSKPVSSGEICFSEKRKKNLLRGKRKSFHTKISHHKIFVLKK